LPAQFTITQEAKQKTSPLIILGDRPLNLETPLERLTDWQTPTTLFFVRSHFGPPAVGLHAWSIAVDGLVERPTRLPLELLQRFETVELSAVLQCAGNGRAYFDPVIPGLPWRDGAVGNARWSGVRLRDVLRAAGIDTKSTHVHVFGGDPPPHPKTPAFLRSLPIERALDPNTLLATRMNGNEIPVEHGGPVRLVVPGWTGNHWIKWLRKIVCSTEEAPGFFQRTGYRIPREPMAPGVEVPPGDLLPVTWLNVKSLIVTPNPNARIAPGPTSVRGVAWTGEGRVSHVEVSLDNGPWKAATLEGPNEHFAWRAWRFEWDAISGHHAIRARATDSNNQTQPERTPWNKSGYLWNGIHEVNIEVT
jgi:DMSO/TMAO reductase YedYZ molybdopterin-dependent catalytic subunit